MSYPTIATFVHREPAPGKALEAALDLARQFDAHLHIVAPGLDRTEPGFYYAGAHAVAVRENQENARDEARILSESISKRMKGETVRWDMEDRVVQASALSDHIAERVRLSDLVVLDAPYSEKSVSEEIAALEATLFRARAPALVIPADMGGAVGLTPKRILLAWNESDEALRACRSAFPFLKSADDTEIAIIDPPRHPSGLTDPGGALASYLARHSIPAEISVLARTETDIADILIRHANESGAGMIVMGAYGHTRLREAIIGGATRHMLERANMPVLMAR
ncbi:MAG: universal stress protein [Boseongicola sp.]